MPSTLYFLSTPVNNRLHSFMCVGKFLLLVQKEIEDRQNFLEEMISLGQGEKYRPIISTEISQVNYTLIFITSL